MRIHSLSGEGVSCVPSLSHVNAANALKLIICNTHSNLHSEMCTMGQLGRGAPLANFLALATASHECLCMSFLSEGLAVCWGSHFKVNYVDIVSSSYFFLSPTTLFCEPATTPLPQPPPFHTHTQTQHALRIHSTPDATKTSAGSERQQQPMGGKAVQPAGCQVTQIN